MSLYSEYYLSHHGVKGMKWGVRRYQNEDGTLTDAGRKRLAKSIQRSAKAQSPKHMLEKTSDKLKEELERETSFKETSTKLRKLVDQFEKAVDEGYYAKTDREYEKAQKKVDEAWDRYTNERKKAVELLLGQYANTSVKTIRGNTTAITDGETIATFALDKLSGWRFKGMS